MADEEAKNSTNQGLSPLVSLVLILNLVATGTIAYFQFKFMKQQASQPSITELIKQEMSGGANSEANKELVVKTNVVDEGIIMPLDGFTVNLAQGDGPRRFVRLNAVLKFSKNSKQEEFEARKPQIRDTIISILNSKRPDDLLKREGKNYLKEEIKSAINSFLVDGEIVDVYYVGFQIN
jgi:flagellar FliL protein